jgi:prepilin-type N-terminal cleavage/methylation domain-containing protein
MFFFTTNRLSIDRSETRTGLPRACAARRRGFTLVELLVVISIIAILAVLVIGAIRGAQQDTLASKTRSTIAKIEAVLNERMEEYLSRTLDFDSDSYLNGSLVKVPAGNASTVFVQRERFPTENIRKFPYAQRLNDPKAPATPGRTSPPYLATNVRQIGILKERVRIAAIRDLMRLEMPDCPGDLFTARFVRSSYPSIYSPGLPLAAPVHLVTGFQETSPTSTPSPIGVLQRLASPPEFERILSRIWAASALKTPLSMDCAESNFNEELLYLIVEGSTLDGESAIGTFAASEIADTDKDGLFEFIDAWGTPIRWIRWPSGILARSPSNPDPLNTNDPVGTDAFDPTQADVGFDPVQGTFDPNPAWPGFQPKPLVISAGADQRFGVRFYSLDPATVGGGSPTTDPIFSPSRVTLSGGSIPARPGYWPTIFNWPDPYFPRVVTGNTPIQSLAFKRGATLDPSVDTVHDPIGVELDGTGVPSFIPNPSNDTRYALHAQDNISNLDGTGP